LLTCSFPGAKTESIPGGSHVEILQIVLNTGEQLGDVLREQVLYRENKVYSEYSICRVQMHEEYIDTSILLILYNQSTAPK
jgi:hypothetical protein